MLLGDEDSQMVSDSHFQLPEGLVMHVKDVA